MRKRKYLVLTLALLSLATLSFAADGYHVGLANSLPSVSTLKNPHLGTISYLLNFAAIPDHWGGYPNTGDPNAPCIKYGAKNPQICFLDYNVYRTAGRPSIRLEPHTTADINTNREVDSRWYFAPTVKPGDHIFAKCWIKTTASSTGASDYRLGGRIGIDCYARTYALDGTELGFLVVDAANEVVGGPAKGNIPGQDCILNWNNPTWTKKGWDFIIPTAYYTKVYVGFEQVPCKPVQIESIVVWLDVRPVTDAGLVWFADAELYINPTTAH